MGLCGDGGYLGMGLGLGLGHGLNVHEGAHGCRVLAALPLAEADCHGAVSAAENLDQTLINSFQALQLEELKPELLLISQLLENVHEVNSLYSEANLPAVQSVQEEPGGLL